MSYFSFPDIYFISILSSIWVFYSGVQSFQTTTGPVRCVMPIFKEPLGGKRITGNAKAINTVTCSRSQEDIHGQNFTTSKENVHELQKKTMNRLFTVSCFSLTACQYCNLPPFCYIACNCFNSICIQ